MDNWEAEVAPAPAEVVIKLFGKWTSEDVQVNDMSLSVSSYCLYLSCKRY